MLRTKERGRREGEIGVERKGEREREREIEGQTEKIHVK